MNKIKKIYHYPVKIESHKEGGFHAYSPKLQGAWADGDTVKEAIENLQDIIKHILEYRQEQRKRMIVPAILPVAQRGLIGELNVTVYV